jgi:hypothetical protein
VQHTTMPGGRSLPRQIICLETVTRAPVSADSNATTDGIMVDKTPGTKGTSILSIAATARDTSTILEGENIYSQVCLRHTYARECMSRFEWRHSTLPIEAETMIAMPALHHHCIGKAANPHLE